MSEGDANTPTPFDQSQICERIDKSLQEHGWSWGDLSQRTGIDERTFRRWRAGATVPQIGRLREVASALGGTYGGLVDGLSLREDSSRARARLSDSGGRPAPDPWKLASDELFVGREATMQALRDALAERRSINIVGDPRMGKSSLLKTWAQRARGGGIVVVGVSGDTTSGRSARSLVRAITGADAPDDADGAADALADWARAKKRNGQPPLVAIDELDELAPHVEKRFFRRLRGMVDGGALVFVVATRRPLAELEPLGQTSPFDSAVSTEPIGLLEPAAAEALAQSGREELAPGDLELIARWSGRHPFYVKLLAHHLVRARRAPAPASQAIDAFRSDAGPELMKLWRDHLDSGERASLLSHLTGKGLAEKDSRKLRRRGILTEEGKPFGEVLTRWLEELSGA